MLGDREKQAIEQGPNLGAVLDHIEFLRDANANIDQPYVLELRSLSEGAAPSSLIFEPYYCAIRYPLSCFGALLHDPKEPTCDLGQHQQSNA